MKRILFVVVVLLAAASFAMAQKDMKATEAKLIQMDKDWTAAELRGDAKAAGEYLADDYWQSNDQATMQNKAQYLMEIKASKDMDMADDYVVRFFGKDVAVMTHRGTITGERNFQYRSTHVWVNRGGKWQIVAHHSGDVAPAAAMSDMTPAAVTTAKPAAKAKSAAAASASDVKSE
ncbi:MAG: nuclear transport factor 2 family protein [Pyrinomonadaceae bacterium]